MAKCMDRPCKREANGSDRGPNDPVEVHRATHAALCEPILSGGTYSTAISIDNIFISILISNEMFFYLLHPVAAPGF